MIMSTNKEDECCMSGEHVYELPVFQRLHLDASNRIKDTQIAPADKQNKQTVTDPCLYVPVFLVCLPAASGIWPQTPAAVPVRFLTRF